MLDVPGCHGQPSCISCRMLDVPGCHSLPLLYFLVYVGCSWLTRPAPPVFPAVCWMFLAATASPSCISCRMLDVPGCHSQPLLYFLPYVGCSWLPRPAPPVFPGVCWMFLAAMASPSCISCRILDVPGCHGQPLLYFLPYVGCSWLPQPAPPVFPAVCWMFLAATASPSCVSCRILDVPGCHGQPLLYFLPYV